MQFFFWEVIYISIFIYKGWGNIFDQHQHHNTRHISPPWHPKLTGAYIYYISILSNRYDISHLYLGIRRVVPKVQPKFYGILIEVAIPEHICDLILWTSFPFIPKPLGHVQPSSLAMWFHHPIHPCFCSSSKIELQGISNWALNMQNKICVEHWYGGRRK